jgi:hypothetical protein
MKTGIRFLTVVIFSGFIGSLSAQQVGGQGGQKVQRTPEESSKAQVDWMTTDLKLDDATQQKVYDVVLKYTRQTTEERQKSTNSGNRDTMRAKMTEIMAARDKELKIILGIRKYELFKTKESERRQASMSRRQN